VIGDMWRDVGAARAAGCRSILIRRDYNVDAEPDVEVSSLSEAVETVLTDAA
jgi:FMN phosphatase YigB (HAD superfamily)